MWEQIVLLKYQGPATALSLVPVIGSIDDPHDKAMAMLMLLSVLRRGDVPPNPFPDTPATDLVPAPSVIRPSFTTPSQAIPLTAPVLLSDPVRRTKEAAWRRQIEALRTSIVATPGQAAEKGSNA